MTETEILFSLVTILILGIGSQWIAWKIRVPSIVVLLVSGFLFGPILNILHPTALLGDLLYPWVSIMVSIIVFDGGMSLRLKDLKEIGNSVWRLVIIGTLISFGIISAANYMILGLSMEVSILFGAMMVITGPTVIVPMLRHVRLSRSFGSLMRWEGILIAPVGTILIVLVYQFFFSGDGTGTLASTIFTLLKTVGVGSGCGLVGALMIMQIVRRKLAPDFLQEVIALMLVIAIYSMSNVVESGSGLVAMVIMGIFLANQRTVMVRHIMVFKENLRVLALSTLFIVLSSSQGLAQITTKINWHSFWYLLVLIFLARPVAVWISMIGSSLSWQEKTFLSWMAPRGIVTASIASLFALRLVDQGVPGADELVLLAFLVIIVTVGLYGFSAERVQNILGLSMEGGDGVLMVGANVFARKLAVALKGLGVHSVLVDTNKDSVLEARVDGLNAQHTSAFSDQILPEVEMGGISKLFSLSSSDDVNMLSQIHFSETVGADNVFRLASEDTDTRRLEVMKPFEKGAQLFGKGISHSYLNMRINAGAKLDVITLTKDYNYKAFTVKYGDRALPLMAVSSEKKINPHVMDEDFEPKSGDFLIILT